MVMVKLSAMVQIGGDWFNAITYAGSGVFMVTGSFRPLFYASDRELQAFVIFG